MLIEDGHIIVSADGVVNDFIVGVVVDEKDKEIVRMHLVVSCMDLLKESAVCIMIDDFVQVTKEVNHIIKNTDIGIKTERKSKI